MASLTQWTWVWVNPGSWWWAEKPGVLQSMGSQRVRHEWETEHTHTYRTQSSSVQFNSVAQLCPTLCDPMDHSTPGFSAHHQLLEFTQTHVHWVSDAIQPSDPLRPLLLLPSIFPSIRVFSNEPALHMRWPKYWSFSFNISPSNEYSGLISFSMDCWISLQFKSLLQHHSSKASILWRSAFFIAQLSHS